MSRTFQLGCRYSSRNHDCLLFRFSTLVVGGLHVSRIFEKNRYCHLSQYVLFRSSGINVRLYTFVPFACHTYHMSTFFFLTQNATIEKIIILAISIFLAIYETIQRLLDLFMAQSLFFYVYRKTFST